MSAPLRCPHCAGTLSVAGRPRCEWCGGALPIAPTPTGGPASAAPQPTFAIPPPSASDASTSRTSLVGCLLFVLLAGAALFVLAALFFGVRKAAAHETVEQTFIEKVDEQHSPRQPPATDVPVERAKPTSER